MLSLHFDHDVDGKDTDGALVLVDCCEGCGHQTEAVRGQVLRVRRRGLEPCLFLGNIDHMLLQMPGEDMYQGFSAVIQEVNAVIAPCADALMGDVQVHPQKGTVAFGGGLQDWGFTIERFAQLYVQKWGIQKEKMMQRMWGDSFYNATKKVWTNVMQPEGCAEPLQRAFCQFILFPISQLMGAIMNNDKEKYEKMMGSLGIVLVDDEKALTGEALVKRAMQIWLSAADALLAMIATKLPSPRTAPMDQGRDQSDENPRKPLTIYVAKLLPTSDKGPFVYAFGRTFSGTIAAGQRVCIQGG